MAILDKEQVKEGALAQWPINGKPGTGDIFGLLWQNYISDTSRGTLQWEVWENDVKVGTVAAVGPATYNIKAKTRFVAVWDGYGGGGGEEETDIFDVYKIVKIEIEEDNKSIDFKQHDVNTRFRFLTADNESKTLGNNLGDKLIVYVKTGNGVWETNGVFKSYSFNTSSNWYDAVINFPINETQNDIVKSYKVGYKGKLEYPNSNILGTLTVTQGKNSGEDADVYAKIYAVEIEDVTVYKNYKSQIVLTRLWMYETEEERQAKQSKYYGIKSLRPLACFLGNENGYTDDLAVMYSWMYDETEKCYIAGFWVNENTKNTTKTTKYKLAWTSLEIRDNGSVYWDGVSYKVPLNSPNSIGDLVVLQTPYGEEEETRNREKITLEPETTNLQKSGGTVTFVVKYYIDGKHVKIFSFMQQKLFLLCKENTEGKLTIGECTYNETTGDFDFKVVFNGGNEETFTFYAVRSDYTQIEKFDECIVLTSNTATVKIGEGGTVEPDNYTLLLECDSSYDYKEQGLDNTKIYLKKNGVNYGDNTLLNEIQIVTGGDIVFEMGSTTPMGTGTVYFGARIKENKKTESITGTIKATLPSLGLESNTITITQGGYEGVVEHTYSLTYADSTREKYYSDWEKEPSFDFYLLPKKDGVVVTGLTASDFDMEENDIIFFDQPDIIGCVYVDNTKGYKLTFNLRYTSDGSQQGYYSMRPYWTVDGKDIFANNVPVAVDFYVYPEEEEDEEGYTLGYVPVIEELTLSEFNSGETFSFYLLPKYNNSIVMSLTINSFGFNDKNSDKMSGPVITSLTYESSTKGYLCKVRLTYSGGNQNASYTFEPYWTLGTGQRIMVTNYPMPRTLSLTSSVTETYSLEIEDNDNTRITISASGGIGYFFVIPKKGTTFVENLTYNDFVLHVDSGNMTTNDIHLVGLDPTIRSDAYRAVVQVSPNTQTTLRTAVLSLAWGNKVLHEECEGRAKITQTSTAISNDWKFTISAEYGVTTFPKEGEFLHILGKLTYKGAPYTGQWYAYHIGCNYEDGYPDYLNASAPTVVQNNNGEMDQYIQILENTTGKARSFKIALTYDANDDKTYGVLSNTLTITQLATSGSSSGTEFEVYFDTENITTDYKTKTLNIGVGLMQDHSEVSNIGFARNSFSLTRSDGLSASELEISVNTGQPVPKLQLFIGKLTENTTPFNRNFKVKAAFDYLGDYAEKELDIKQTAYDYYLDFYGHSSTIAGTTLNGAKQQKNLALCLYKNGETTPTTGVNGNSVIELKQTNTTTGCTITSTSGAPSSAAKNYLLDFDKYTGSLTKKYNFKAEANIDGKIVIPLNFTIQQEKGDYEDTVYKLIIHSNTATEFEYEETNIYIPVGIQCGDKSPEQSYNLPEYDALKNNISLTLTGDTTMLELVNNNTSGAPTGYRMFHYKVKENTNTTQRSVKVKATCKTTDGITPLASDELIVKQSGKPITHNYSLKLTATSNTMQQSGGDRTLHADLTDGGSPVTDTSILNNITIAQANDTEGVTLNEYTIAAANGRRSRKIHFESNETTSDKSFQFKASVSGITCNDSNVVTIKQDKKINYSVSIDYNPTSITPEGMTGNQFTVTVKLYANGEVVTTKTDIEGLTLNELKGTAGCTIGNETYDSTNNAMVWHPTIEANTTGSKREYQFQGVHSEYNATGSKVISQDFYIPGDKPYEDAVSSSVAEEGDILYAHKCIKNGEEVYEQVLVSYNDYQNAPSGTYKNDKWTPIGIVAIPGSHNVYGDGSCGVVSLVNMSVKTPDKGTTSTLDGDYHLKLHEQSDKLLKQYMSVMAYTDDKMLVTQEIAIDNASYDGAYLPSTYYNGVTDLVDVYSSYYEEANINNRNKMIPSPYTSYGARNDVYKNNASNNCANNDFNGVAEQANLLTKAGDTNKSLTMTTPYGGIIATYRFTPTSCKQGDWHPATFGEFAYIIRNMQRIDSIISSLSAGTSSLYIKINPSVGITYETLTQAYAGAGDLTYTVTMDEGSYVSLYPSTGGAVRAMLKFKTTTANTSFTDKKYGGGLKPGETDFGDIVFDHKYTESGSTKYETVIMRSIDITKYPSSHWTPIGVVIVPGKHNRYGDGSCGVAYCGKDFHNGKWETDRAYSLTLKNVVNIGRTKSYYYSTNNDKNNTIASVSGLQTEIPAPSDFIKYNSNSVILCQHDKNCAYMGTLNDVFMISPFTTTGTSNKNSDFAKNNDDAFSDMNGKSNTQLLNNNAENDSIIKTVNTFKTNSTSAGDWYIPSFGEIIYMYTRWNQLRSMKLTGYNANIQYSPWNTTYSFLTSTVTGKDSFLGMEYSERMTYNFDKGFILPFMRLK